MSIGPLSPEQDYPFHNKIADRLWQVSNAVTAFAVLQGISFIVLLVAEKSGLRSIIVHKFGFVVFVVLTVVANFIYPAVICKCHRWEMEFRGLLITDRRSQVLRKLALGKIAAGFVIQALMLLTALGSFCARNGLAVCSTPSG